MGGMRHPKKSLPTCTPVCLCAFAVGLVTMDPQRPTQVEEDALRSFNAAIAHLTRNALTAEQAAVDLEAMHDAVEIGMLAQRGDVTKDQVLYAVNSFKERETRWPVESAHALGGACLGASSPLLTTASQSVTNVFQTYSWPSSASPANQSCRA